MDSVRQMRRSDYANLVGKSMVSPAAAPATSSVLRSLLVKWNSWAIVEPTAPPVINNRAFGAERSAGADGCRGRERLENGYFRLDPAAIDQDGLDGLRNTVAADALRAVARHYADDKRARDRHQDLQPAKVVARRGNQRRAPAPKKRRGW